MTSYDIMPEQKGEGNLSYSRSGWLFFNKKIKKMIATFKMRGTIGNIALKIGILRDL
ncbi:hypothetical protein [Ruminococcus sp. 5_1_39BFAA]|uniref:hypothetical protein n=1 Tax=Ruminococcus sp. 5_1_39BFAA TaxID=457412 RepID=UPI003566185E